MAARRSVALDAASMAAIGAAGNDRVDAGQQCAPLGAAGAVGDGIRQEHVAQRDRAPRYPPGSRCAAVTSGKSAAAALRKRLPRERAHAGGIGDVSVLHARFEPSRMSEPAGGEPRVDQLPHQKFIVSIA